MKSAYLVATLGVFYLMLSAAPAHASSCWSVCTTRTCCQQHNGPCYGGLGSCNCECKGYPPPICAVKHVCGVCAIGITCVFPCTSASTATESSTNLKTVSLQESLVPQSAIPWDTPQGAAGVVLNLKHRPWLADKNLYDKLLPHSKTFARLVELEQSEQLNPANPVRSRALTSEYENAEDTVRHNQFLLAPPYDDGVSDPVQWHEVRTVAGQLADYPKGADIYHVEKPLPPDTPDGAMMLILTPNTWTLLKHDRSKLAEGPITIP